MANSHKCGPYKQKQLKSSGRLFLYPFFYIGYKTFSFIKGNFKIIVFEGGFISWFIPISVFIYDHISALNSIVM